jgi:hypothetical protein
MRWECGGERLAIYGVKPGRSHPYAVATLATGADRIAMLTIFLVITGNSVVEASAPGYGYNCNVAEARCRQEWSGLLLEPLKHCRAQQGGERRRGTQ